MNQQLDVKSRKELEAQMATVFGDNIKNLSEELQEILIDDIATAFESRLIVFKRFNEN